MHTQPTEQVGCVGAARREVPASGVSTAECSADQKTSDQRIAISHGVQQQLRLPVRDLLGAPQAVGAVGIDEERHAGREANTADDQRGTVNGHGGSFTAHSKRSQGSHLVCVCKIGRVTEPTNPTNPVHNPTPAADVPETHQAAGTREAPETRRPDRLYRVAALVGIVAGGLVIVAIVFGSGFFLGMQVGDAHDRGPGPRHLSEIMEMRPAQPPFGRMERQPGPDQQFPNFPAPPQPPEGTATPQRPSATPTP